MFLKNKNIIFKIRRSKVTDYAALITFISFESLIVLSMDILQSHSVLLRSRMIALLGLRFDLPPLDY